MQELTKKISAEFQKSLDGILSRNSSNGSGKSISSKSA